MILPLILTVAAFVLIAGAVGGERRAPLVVLGGLVLLGASVLLRLLGSPGPFGSGAWATGSATFFDVGLGLLAGSVVLAARHRPAGPFAFIGVVALLISGALFGASAAFDEPTLHSEADLELSEEAEVAEFLLELGPDDSISEVSGILDEYDARYARAFPEVTLRQDENLAQVYLVRVAKRAARALMDRLLADRENVDYAALNRAVSLAPLVADVPAAREGALLENDPLAPQQWALYAVGGHEAHRMLRDATPVRKARIAILDTGVDAAHADLGAVFAGGSIETDTHGHGTHCAGIAGAATNNGEGVASLNWEGRFVEVVAYPALGALGNGSVETIAQAVIDAALGGADVLSLSLGDVSDAPPKVLADAIAFAQRRGALVVASAGNSAQDAATHYPSNMDGVIAVAALGEDGRLASFSNTVASLSRPIAAPGVGILSTVPDGGYRPMNGTSMAAPLVAGLLGVLRSLDPGLTGEDAYAILHDTGTDTPDGALTGRQIRADAAIARVLSRADVSALRPAVSDELPIR